MKQARVVPVLWAAFGAAVGSTVIELLLWAMTGDDAVHNLFRDARLTAAIVMGPRVLGASGGFDPLVMGVATLVHAALSLVYAAVLARLIRSLPLVAALFAGGAFGFLLYGVNLYGFTAIFPWFIPVRGAITLIAHLVFGITAAAVYHVARRHATR
ncbi:MULTISPECIES: sodium:proline symporter [Burkholderia]|uniref:sodium:proline symporter n=1 Tax=Burkholderia TaxID=32008 RepID=UPI000F5A1DAA|nr:MULTISPECIES: sodium:proline symporter [Burkholderia]MCA8107156.1 sodium:proline symporter [Burkholderia sp. AU36459]MDF3090666.1 sodium:proline symporter [Burkholderia semiarida]MDF3103104.1 sodium:proline symporter [Burkholderia semiarida]MDF3114150.1 sodium:proline symporter [Burkholderia semiarida]RQV80012.1 sodium:proline symporter [Burkholderia anthina]